MDGAQMLEQCLQAFKLVDAKELVPMKELIEQLVQ